MVRSHGIHGLVVTQRINMKEKIVIVVRLPGEPAFPKESFLNREHHLHPEHWKHPVEVMEYVDEVLDNLQHDHYILTHSEHIVLRLCRRIKERKLSPSSVAFFVLHKGELVKLRINERGEFIDDWPGGFFEERIHEVFL